LIGKSYNIKEMEKTI